VQIATDAGFNPALIDITTVNLRFINSTMLPNGIYFWRLRSVDKDGGFSKVVERAQVHAEVERHGDAARACEPHATAYPTPTILSWTPVPGATSYKVSVATGASGGGVDAPRGIISTGALAWRQQRRPDLDVQYEPRESRRPLHPAPTTGRSSGRRGGPRRDGLDDLSRSPGSGPVSRRRP